MIRVWIIVFKGSLRILGADKAYTARDFRALIPGRISMEAALRNPAFGICARLNNTLSKPTCNIGATSLHVPSTHTYIYYKR